MQPHKLITISLFLFLSISLFSQEKYYDIETRTLLDSLDKRILDLNKKIQNFGGNRDATYFYSKRELDMTIFLREYEELIFDENLLQAQRLIESRVKTSEKRSDKFAVDYYLGYKTMLTKLRSSKRAHYQKLFAKEKTFKKEYDKYIKPGDEFAYVKALRMLELAINFALEMGLNETLDYLVRYENYTRALLMDLNSNYELDKLTSTESSFQKVFNVLLESDSLDILIQAQELVNSCSNYSAKALSNLDTNYFAMQRIVVANAMADWNERQGISTELSSLTGQAVVARRDSLNREGIYQWNDLIVVIGSVNFDSKSENVMRGEAIIAADRRLYNYIRINKVANVNRKMELGKTYLLPIEDKDKVGYFRFDHDKNAWQYMVAYSIVINKKTTEEIGRFLPPLQFQDYISDIIPQENE